MLKILAQPLRRQLVVAIFWLFALMIAAAVGLGFEEFHQAVQELTDQTQAAAIRKASAIERELTGGRQDSPQPVHERGASRSGCQRR